MKIDKILCSVILCIALLCGCSNTVEYDTERNNAWIEDIEEVESQIIKFHADPFKYVSEEKFKADINTLKDKVPKMNDHEIAVQFSKIISEIKDLHTNLYLNSNLYYPFKAKYFGDDLYIIETTEDYKNIIFKKLLKIEGQSIEAIEKKIAEVCSYENDIGKRINVASQLSNPSKLYGLNITKDLKNVHLTLEDKSGKREKVTISSLDYNEDRELKIIDVNSFCDAPLYMKNRGETYYCEYLQEYNTIYFDYNRCIDNNFDDSMDKLLKEIEKKAPEKLIIDLRDNGGGVIRNFSSFKRQFDFFKNKNKDLLDGCQIYTITNNYTVSTAVLVTEYAVNDLNATLIGEPPAQPFKFFAMAAWYPSNNSKLVYRVPTKEFGLGEALKVIEPDIFIPLSIDDYKNGIDPVMKYILN